MDARTARAAGEGSDDSERRAVPDGGVESGATAGRASSTDVVGGLDENVAGALTYALGLLTGLVFYFVEEDNEFVRFHAAQSTIVFGGLAVASLLVLPLLGTVFSYVPVLGTVVGTVLGFAGWALQLAGLALWVILLIKAYQGERYHLPVIGEVAEQYV